VRLEVVGKLGNALRQQGDLDIGAAGILLVHLEALEVLGLCSHIFF
jgi:hypothetical protein